jgi:hypothetical protein
MKGSGDCYDASTAGCLAGKETECDMRHRRFGHKILTVKMSFIWKIF